jgi:hypothetical protein
METINMGETPHMDHRGGYVRAPGHYGYMFDSLIDVQQHSEVVWLLSCCGELFWDHCCPVMMGCQAGSADILRSE